MKISPDRSGPFTYQNLIFYFRDAEHGMSPEPDDPRHQWVPIDGHPTVHHGPYLHMGEKSADSVKNEVKMEPLDYPQTSQAAAVQAHAAQEQYQQWMAHAYGAASLAGSMVYQTQPYHQQIEVQHHAIGFA